MGGGGIKWREPLCSFAENQHYGGGGGGANIYKTLSPAPRILADTRERGGNISNEPEATKAGGDGWERAARRASPSPAVRAPSSLQGAVKPKGGWGRRGGRLKFEGGGEGGASSPPGLRRGRRPWAGGADRGGGESGWLPWPPPPRPAQVLGLGSWTPIGRESLGSRRDCCALG